MQWWIWLLIAPQLLAMTLLMASVVRDWLREKRG